MNKITADSLSRTEIKYSSSFLDLWFDKFNKKYFNGKLSDIPLDWDNSLDCNGCFCFSVDVFSKKAIPLRIKLKKSNINSFDYFRNVLVHEMLHYYVDCYVNEPTDEQWMQAIQLKMTKGEESGEYLDALNLGKDKCHLGNWAKLASKLNSENKELNITAFGDRDTGLMYDEPKVDYDNLHLVYVRYKNNDTGKQAEKYKTYTKEKFEDVIKHIKEYRKKPTSKIEYFFYDFELDKDKLAVSGIGESLGSEAFNESFMDYLKKSGAIKKGVTFLGKTDNYRSFAVV